MAARGYSDVEIEVTIDREELLERLKSNRKKHIREYSRALEIWREEFQKVVSELAVSELDSFPTSLAKLKSDCPRTHELDYDRAIDMFTMCTKNEITFDQDSFNQYCRDEWGWRSETNSNRYFRLAISSFQY